LRLAGLGWENNIANSHLSPGSFKSAAKTAKVLPGAAVITSASLTLSINHAL